MKFNSLRPILWTDQFEETIEYYTDILGFELGEKNEDWGWASASRDNVELMFAKPNHIQFLSNLILQEVFTSMFRMLMKFGKA